MFQHSEIGDLLTSACARVNIPVQVLVLVHLYCKSNNWPILSYLLTLLLVHCTVVLEYEYLLVQVLQVTMEVVRILQVGSYARRQKNIP
jgi:heme/copper-type cytochrome/quinol oxidase subunit 4